MIDQATIDRIMDAAQIYDVVSDFITLRKRGVNYVGLCPFHDDKTPSFYVSPAKGLCKCFWRWRISILKKSICIYRKAVTSRYGHMRHYRKIWN